MDPSGGIPRETAPTFERVEEYKAVLDNMAGFTSRRQNLNNIYVGLNTVFLTAVGFFISTHLNFELSELAVAVVLAVMTLPILFINITWRLALRLYGRGGEVRYEYLRTIEREFQARRGSSGEKDQIGLFRRLEYVDNPGVIHYEKTLATFFICFYPLVSLAFFVITWLVQAHVIPPFSL